MPLFGPAHIAILAGIVMAATVLAIASRMVPEVAGPIHRILGWGLLVNELIYWGLRYSQEGLQPPVNLPLQLYDVTVWTTIIACLTRARWAIEFSFFAGIAGAAVALVQTDLWLPWPSYPAICFFLARGGVLCAISVLVLGGATPLRPWAVWRAYAEVVLYGVFVGLVDFTLNSNYMYLREAPPLPLALIWFGPRPQYLEVGAGITLLLFFILWLPVRPSISTRAAAKMK